MQLSLSTDTSTSLCMVPSVPHADAKKRFIHNALTGLQPISFQQLAGSGSPARLVLLGLEEEQVGRLGTCEHAAWVHA